MTDKALIEQFSKLTQKTYAEQAKWYKIIFGCDFDKKQ